MYEAWWNDNDRTKTNIQRETSAIATFSTIGTKVQKFVSVCYSDISFINSKQSAATSEHVLC
jgi:hypothetical protein